MANATCPLSLQQQHLVMLRCHFSWQAPRLAPRLGDVAAAGATFGEIIGSRSEKCCSFPYNCVSKARKVTSANGRRSDDVQIMVESFAMVNDASTVLGKFLSYFGISFFVADAHFLTLEGDTCCQMQCK